MTTPALQSRLPAVGTTVFTLMSALAQEHGAVNLGQGFPDFGCDPKLLDMVDDAMRAGLNQYPPMAGAAPLREAIAAKIAALYGHGYDAASEITVTAGATQGIITAILCAVHPGDEVILIEPAYDSYLPSIQLAGGVPVPVPMRLGRWRLQRALGCGGRRGDATHAHDHDQHAAQPDRIDPARGRPGGAGRHRRRQRYPGVVRRGV
jgi:methionine aminotransferase